jgi:hypothetical protein
VLVDLAHYGGDLLGRRTARGIAQQGGMSARAVATGCCPSLRGLPTRI